MFGRFEPGLVDLQTADLSTEVQTHLQVGAIFGFGSRWRRRVKGDVRERRDMTGDRKRRARASGFAGECLAFE